MRRFVFTGGPSVGKSTIIRMLSLLGFPVINEIATEVIEQGMKKGIRSFLPWEDHLSFQWEVLQRQLEAEAAVEQATLPVFLDRGVYDAIAYRMVHGWKVQDCLQQLEPARYDVAFIFPPLGTWDDNGVRYEDPDFAREITPYLTRVYESQGVRTVQVPDGTPEERTRFILQTVRQAGAIRRPQMAAAPFRRKRLYQLPLGPSAVDGIVAVGT